MQFFPFCGIKKKQEQKNKKKQMDKPTWQKYVEHYLKKNKKKTKPHLSNFRSIVKSIFIKQQLLYVK